MSSRRGSPAKRCGRAMVRRSKQPVDRSFQQGLFAHRFVAVHGAVFRPHRQSGMQLVSHQHTNQGPVRRPVLVRSRRIGFTQFRRMRSAHRRAIQKERACRTYQRFTHLGHELLEAVVAAFWHHRKRQSLPCLIIGPGVTGWHLTVLAPVSNAFTRARPEAGRQTAEQFQHGGL
jgi:hypothetical protein